MPEHLAKTEEYVPYWKPLPPIPEDDVMPAVYDSTVRMQQATFEEIKQ